MNNNELIQLINKYQGMINSSVFPILDKCKKLKDTETSVDDLEEIVIKEFQKHPDADAFVFNLDSSFFKSSISLALPKIFTVF